MFQYAKAEYVAIGLCLAAYVVTGVVVIVVAATVASRASLAGRAGGARTAVAGVVWGLMIATSPLVFLGVIFTQSDRYNHPVRSAATLAGLFAPVVLARLIAIVTLSTPEPHR